MEKHHVTMFRPYPFTAGQKIRIEDGPRKGDWEVTEVSERKVKLRCPVSHRVFDWNRFCYVVEEREDEQWPQHDE
ncbi:hypothetical protein DENIS_1427 [Desulfonema ishimotonii]|uniref:Uncharacterized protein n=1 Tax=Desulfonema ishimotonii TaxID=45657 RepID=A0A401FU49_9BACT|nr:hypothetical protein [Desulfonema ishimotonii]GBC60474.1 hypothetical protein DENIS_1427 [Desulfonema ishimotonii]